MEINLAAVSLIVSVFSILGVIIAICTYAMNRKKTSTESEEALRQRAYEEGKKDSEVLSSIKRLSEKLDEVIKNQVTKEQFTEVKKAQENFVTREEFADLVARAKSNTHRLDELEGAKNG